MHTLIRLYRRLWCLHKYQKPIIKPIIFIRDLPYYDMEDDVIDCDDYMLFELTYICKNCGKIKRRKVKRYECLKNIS